MWLTIYDADTTEIWSSLTNIELILDQWWVTLFCFHFKSSKLDWRPLHRSVLIMGKLRDPRRSAIVWLLNATGLLSSMDNEEMRLKPVEHQKLLIILNKFTHYTWIKIESKLDFFKIIFFFFFGRNVFLRPNLLQKIHWKIAGIQIFT